MGDVLAESGAQRRRFTVEEYHRLAEVGILRENDRVELIEGEQPDVVILRERPDGYAQAPAEPRDVLLLVEAADTSYRYDRRVKLPLYARSGVPEVWIVDLTHDVVETYRDRDAEHYATTTRVGRGGVVAPAAFPDIALVVDAILPPA